MGDDAEALLAQHRQHVAEVVLAGGVVVLEPIEALDQRLGGECVRARVDLLDGQDVRWDARGVLRLDLHRLDVPGVVADDPPVGPRVVELDRHHGGAGAGGGVGGEQRRDDLGVDQRVITGEDDDGVGVADDVVRRAHGAAGAVGLGLDDRLGAVG